MIFKFTPFVVDVDTERTKSFYAESSQGLTEGCDCIGCRNFIKAAEGFSPKIRGFFSQLGVDICKAPDMSAMYGESEKQILHYLGFYHMCGTILEGESAWVKASHDSFRWDESRSYEVDKGCSVSFSEECHLLEKGFPEPVIQMDVDIQVPWVIEGEQHYLLSE